MSQSPPNQLAAFEDVVQEEARRHVVAGQIRWPGGAKIAVNLTADFDAMLLRRLFNETPMQLAKGEFGGRVGIWRLMELFAQHQVKATIFTPGRICELYPAAVKAAAQSGHEIADHMWEHRVPAEAEIERAHLLRATEAIERLTGRRPVGSRSWHTPELLADLGYIYNSHHHADDRPYFVRHGTGHMLNLPFHLSIDDAMFYSFSWLSSDSAEQRITDSDRVFDLWWDAFLQQHEAGGYLNICMHPFVSGRALRIAMMDRLIGRMKSMQGVWFATCAEVARHCHASVTLPTG